MCSKRDDLLPAAFACRLDALTRDTAQLTDPRDDILHTLEDDPARLMLEEMV